MHVYTEHNKLRIIMGAASLICASILVSCAPAAYVPGPNIIDVTSSSGEIEEGKSIFYNIEYKNTSQTDDFRNVVLGISHDMALTLLTANLSPSKVYTSENTANIEWELGTLQPQQESIIAVKFQVADNIDSAKYDLTVQAWIRGVNPQGTPSSDSGVATAPIKNRVPPTLTPRPTIVLIVSPTPLPQPTASPSYTPTPQPTQTPTPTPTPKPLSAIDRIQESLIGNSASILIAILVFITIMGAVLIVIQYNKSYAVATSLATMTREKTLRQKHLTKLWQILVEYFDEGELRTLCFQLTVDYGILPGEGKANKARELVSYLEHRGLILELENAIKQHRPNVSWE